MTDSTNTEPTVNEMVSTLIFQPSGDPVELEWRKLSAEKKTEFADAIADLDKKADDTPMVYGQYRARINEVIEAMPKTYRPVREEPEDSET